MESNYCLLTSGFRVSLNNASLPLKPLGNPSFPQSESSAKILFATEAPFLSRQRRIEVVGSYKLNDKIKINK